MRTWARRLALGSAILLGSLAALVLAGSLLTRDLAAHRAERDFPAPGRLVEVDGRLSHIHCSGSGSPTILLESGLDDRGSWSWRGVREGLERISRVCSYDRAGLLWSEPGPGPRDAERIADELHALLAAASEPPPYVMVGHSFGGLHVRVFDRRHPGRAAGFVLVDASHPEQERRFPPEIRERMAAAGTPSPWLYRIVAPYRYFAPERATPRTAYWWRSFPEGVLREAAAAEAVYEQAARAGSLGDRPLVVLTSGVAPELPGISAEANAAFRRTLLELHGELAALSTDSEHRIVEGAGHYVHVDRPEAVVEAVRDVVEAVRGGVGVGRSR